MTQYTKAYLQVAYHCWGIGIEPGGFVKSLLACFEKADPENTEKLSKAFPEIGEAVRSVREGRLRREDVEEFMEGQ